MTPTPRTLYVHDDLTDEVVRRCGPDSVPARLAVELLTLVRDRAGVVLLTLDEQLTGLVARGPQPPFALAVGVGRAGERVAAAVHERAGWFPAIGRVEVAREEDGHGGYRLATLGAGPLERQLAGVDGAATLAVVDDTVFSGLTMRVVLGALPAAVLSRTRVFCLRAVAESLPAVAALCPVSAGFVARGRLLEDVSFINASGLVRRGAIRRAGRRPLAFWERREWMSAWFGADASRVIDRCRELGRVLETSACEPRPLTPTA